MSKICPICGNTYTGYPAISRKDNKTEICRECSMIEALQDFYKHTVNNKQKDIKGGE